VSKQQPTAGYILGLVGGILKLIFGLLVVAAGGILGGYGFGLFGDILVFIGVLGIVFGLLIMYFSYLGYNGKGKGNGIVVLILGIIGIFFTPDLYFIGSILAIIGGALLYAQG
jgi:hypothetical protein